MVSPVTTGGGPGTPRGGPAGASHSFLRLMVHLEPTRPPDGTAQGGVQFNRPAPAPSVNQMRRVSLAFATRVRQLESALNRARPKTANTTTLMSDKMSLC